MISSILSLRSKGKCTQQLIPSTCGQSGPSFARTRAGRGRSGRPGAVGRRLDPRALLGRRRQIPAARERREPPGTSPKAQVSPRTRVQQLKEPRRKRKMRWRRGERGRGEWLRAETAVEGENPLSRTGSQPICSAK